jgi:hypothetical protein
MKPWELAMWAVLVLIIAAIVSLPVFLYGVP